jgi:hypothetical protein
VKNKLDFSVEIMYIRYTFNERRLRMRVTLKRVLKLKSGKEYSEGTKFNLKFTEPSGRMILVDSDGVEIRFGGRLDSYFGIKVPSEKTLMKWDSDGYSKSIAGKKVEPDGWDSEGTPSWLVLLGYI